MNRQTASQRASLAPYREVKAREAAILRAQSARQWLQRGSLLVLAVAALAVAVLVGFLAGLTVAPKYYGIDLAREVHRAS